MTKQKGVTLIEMCIAVAIGSMIMTMVMVIMSRTTRHYKKGTEIMNVQILMDNITGHLRNDIKGLRAIEGEVTEHKLSFKIVDTRNKKTDPKKLVTVTYKVENSSKQTRDGKPLYKLTRTIGNKSTTMHSENQLKYIHFKAVAKKNENAQTESQINAKNLDHIEMGMQLISDVNGEGGYSTMSFVCNFYSNCLDNQL